MKRKLLAFIISIALAYVAKGQVALISANPSTGCAHLPVLFTDSSTGNPTSWTWDFGDGTANSTSKNPGLHVYNLPGTYTVTLTLNNGSSVKKTITIYNSPTVQFTANKTSGCFPLAVNFMDQSTPGSGTITNWNWDFGDGNTSNIQSPSHTYTAASNFPVALQVINSFGCATVLTKTSFIQILNGVTASFKITTSSGCKVPITVDFNNTTTGPATLSYIWNFGDATPTSTLTNPTHTYNNSSPGNGYPISLIATSTAGCADTLVQITPILAGNVSSSFIAPDSVCVGTSINLLNTSSPTPTVSSWDFGDGTGSNSISVPSKTYSTAGNFNIKLVNTFGACIDSISKTIHVFNPAVANFTAANTTTCNNTLTVNFQDQSTTASSWFWNFGDGTSSTQKNPSHTYNGYGIYSVSLTVSNATGCSGSITKTSFIQLGKPAVHVTNLPGYGCAPFTFNPVLVDTVIDGIASYAWNFGDGTTSTSGTPSHVYSTAGSYPVTLVVTTNGGCTVTVSDTVKVGNTRPVPNFTESPVQSCVKQPINFKDQTPGGTANQWLWEFGDGFTSSAENPVYMYQNPGTYTVTLIAYNNGCPDSVKKINLITINAPKANFGYTYTCSANNTTFAFHDSSAGPSTWLWNFGDGSPTSNVQNPVHNYPLGNNAYNVTLTVTNTASGCTDTYMDTARVIQVAVNSIFVSYSPVCVNTDEHFLTIVSNNALVKSFFYNFGDTAYNPGYTSNVDFYYKKPGNYTFTATITDLNGCKDSLSTPVVVSGPTAAFTTGATSGCYGINASFTDQSKSDGVHAITQWIWSWGDSTSQTFTAPPFTHNYTKQGIYTVTLKVVDASGCTDSITKGNLITVSQPTASFTAVDSLSCPGTPIQCINNSKGYGLTYTWNFGDGSPTSGVTSPTHSYAIGTYGVSLNVVDQFGCTASITKNPYITVDTPHAAFTLTSTFGTCPPLVDTFTFQGSYYQSILWTFGDGGTSSLVDPVHYYTIPGSYSAGLTVISHGGCIATAPNVPITILGPYGALNYSPLQGCHTLTVNLSVVTSNVVTYIWVFTNSNVDSTLTPSTTYTYDTVGKFVPIVILENATGCAVPVKGVDTIFIYGSKPRFGVDKPVLCQSGTVQFSDSTTSPFAITNYLWDFGDGSATSSQQNPQHFYANPGSYTVKLVVTTQTGCQDSIIQTNLIKVVANPVVSIGGVTSECVPASISCQGVIVVPDTSAFTWAWNFYNGQTAAVQNPNSQLYNTAGSDSVQLIATNSSGCSDTVLEYFQVHPLPVVNAGPDTTICLGQGITLNPTGAVSYIWGNSASLSCTSCTNPVATPTSTTTYTVTGTSSFGCTNTDTIVVNVIQPGTLQLTPHTDSICLGQQVQLNATGESVYTWTPAAGLSNPAIGNPVASPDTTTTYQVSGTDIKSCFTQTQSVVISVFPYPTINVGPPNASIPIGTTYQISGTGSSDIDSILWTPALGLSCTTCLSPIASPVTTTTYTIRVKNNGGCTTTDSIRIIVTCSGQNLYVPNTFSPNGDKVNDVFYVRGKGLSTVQSMRVYNRWGQLVFEKRDFAPNDESVGWDGTFNGKPCPIDVYVYTIEVICENSQVVPYQGNVALIR